MKRFVELLPNPYNPLFLTLTAVFSFIAILINLNNLIGIFLVVGAAILLQFFVSQNGIILNKLVPLRKLSRDKKTILKANNKKLLTYILVFIPVIAMIWVPISLIILVICLIFLTPLFFNQARSILSKANDQKNLKSNYKNNAPQIIVYLSGPRTLSYQIDQWLEVLEKLPWKVAIILRDDQVYSLMLSTNIDIYYARSGRELEWLSLNGPKIVLYPNNREKNANALRYNSLTHIFINHGESDKATNQSKMLMAYDHLFVGGSIAKDRLLQAGLPVRDKQVVYVGRPQAELMLQFVDKVPKKIKKIFYAPTWEGDADMTGYSSVGALGVELLEKLIASNRFEIRVKLHPMTGTSKVKVKLACDKIRDICTNENIELLDTKSSLHDAMNWSDMLICDISAVLNEYLITRKPIILCNVMNKDRDTNKIHKEFPSSKAAYILSNGSKIIDIIEKIEENDPIRDDRDKVRENSLGKGNSFDRFSKALAKFIE